MSLEVHFSFFLFSLIFYFAIYKLIIILIFRNYNVHLQEVRVIVKVRFRVTYTVLRFYVRPPIQEEGDAGKFTPACSSVQDSPSILRTQMQYQVRASYSIKRIHRQCMYVFMYVLRKYDS